MPEEDSFSRAALHAAGAHLVVADREGRILICSEAFRIRAGLAEDYAGLPAHRVGFAQDDEPAALSPFANVDAQDFPNESRRYWGRPLAGMHWNNTALRDGQGRVTHVVGTGTDAGEQPWMRREVLRISEQERRRIGQDLHDGLGQMLTAITLLSRELASSLSSAGRLEAPLAQELVTLSRRADAETRHLARGLMPVSFDSGGLEDALAHLAADVERIFRIPCVADIEAGLPHVDDAIAIDLYHIAQEAANNALKHGRPRRVDISLHRTQHLVELVVRDDGKGMAPEEVQEEAGLGLRIMRYRALSIGGMLQIDSTPGSGTVVTCRAPFTKRPLRGGRPIHTDRTPSKTRK
jgi:signal transduction histidine kinase